MATAENEPGRQDRIMVSKTKDGQGIYMRNPVGKIGEEFKPLLQALEGNIGPAIDKAKAKMSTFVKPGLDVLVNDKGFGRKLYNKYADTPEQFLSEVIGPIMHHLATAQTPEGQIRAFADFLTGKGDQTLSTLQTFGPLAGFTFSRGHPGGPAAGELARFKEAREFTRGEEMTALRKMVRDGDIEGAKKRMNELKLAPGLQRSILYPRTSPQQIRELMKSGTPEQIERYRRQLEAQ